MKNEEWSVKRLGLQARSSVFIMMASLLFVACSEAIDKRQHVSQLISASEQMLDENRIDSAWVLLQSAYDYSMVHHYNAGTAEALLAMARHHNMMDRPDSAIACLRHGLEFAPSGSDDLHAQFYAELSATYNITGDMRACVEWADRALPLMRLYGSDEDFAIMCGNTGIAWRRLGRQDSAAVLYRQGLERALAVGDYGSQAYLANNLSVLYTEMGRYDEGISYADQACEAARHAGDDVERLSALAGKGIALQLSHKSREAIEILKSTFDEAQATNSTALKLKTINYLLKALVDARQWEVAARYLALGEDLAATLPPGNTAAAGILEAKMILQTEQGHCVDALSTIDSLETLMSLQQVIPPFRLMHYKGRCLAALGDYRKAYDLQVRSGELSDSIRSRENDAKLDVLATNIRVMEKELALSRLEQKQARTQHTVILLAALLAVFASAVAALIFYLRHRRGQAAMRETRKYVEGIEQERSRFARELHDGACNELLAIGMQLRRDSPDVASVTRQIATLRSGLRNLSHELMPPQFAEGVSLRDALAHYLSHIEQPAVSFRCDGSGWERIPAATAYQYYRIAQEAIGNIIVHQPEAQVEATLTNDADGLSLTIASAGTVVQGDGAGIGLQSLRERAQSIAATLTTKQTPTSFTLHIATH